jgi:hypothetical protein
MTPSGDQDYFHPRFICTLKCRQISLGDLELGVEQGAVNIHGEQADGGIRHK